MAKPGTSGLGGWDRIQEWDIERFGADLRDADALYRWSGAFAIAGGLPYIWRDLARPLCDMIYGLLELRAGDRVLIIGEAVEPSGWAEDIGQIVGASGQVDVVEIIEEGRNAVVSGELGRNGVPGCWRWAYADGIPDASYDCVAILQSTQHCDDWAETGRELVRVMKPGRRIVLAEAVLAGAHFDERVNADVHIRQWYAKVRHFFPDRIPYYSGEELLEAFGDALEAPQIFEWRGIEMLWGRKPDPAAAT